MQPMIVPLDGFSYLKENFRRTCRGLLICMALCAGLIVGIYTPPHGWNDWISPLFIGIVFGVPGGLILYPVYRFLRFALGR